MSPLEVEKNMNNISRARIKHLSAVLVTVLSLLGAAASAAPSASLGTQSKTLNASADTFVRPGPPNTNQGAWSYLRVRAAGDNRALVRFDRDQLRAAVGTGELVSATLTFHINRALNWGTEGGTIGLHRLTVDWAEGNGFDAEGENSVGRRGTGPGATWACAIDANIANHVKDCSGPTEWEMGKPNRPDLHQWVDAATASSVIQTGQTGSLSFDVTGDVLAFLSGEAANDGWIVKKDKRSETGRIQLASRETENGPQLVLVMQSGDTGVPQVESAGLSATDPSGDYVDGNEVYSVDVTAADTGTGVAGVAVDRVGGTELATSAADCSGSCPAEYSSTHGIDTSGFSEGAYQVVAKATDQAGNIGVSDPWTVWVDRTPPSSVSNIRIARFDEANAATTVGWDSGDDPQLTDGSPGSGVQSFEYRYRVSNGDWTDYSWTDFPEFTLPNSSLGDIVDVEVREADQVGNVSSSQSATLTVFAASESTPWYSDITPDPGTDVTLTDDQKAIAENAATSDPRIQPLLADRNWSVTGVDPWSTQGTQDTVFGAYITITWSDPAVLDATWSIVDFPDSSASYTVDQVSYRSLDTTSLEVYVTFDPLLVVGFQPLDGTADEGSINVLVKGKSVSPSIALSSSSLSKVRSASPTSSAVSHSYSTYPDWVHGINPHLISDSNSWFTDGDYFWNYDFNATNFEVTKKPVAQYHADWPVAVIFTNEASVQIAKFIWGGSIIGKPVWKDPMHTRVYDRAPRTPGNYLNKPGWVSDSGTYLGNVCFGTKWHYRVYAPTDNLYHADSMYNLTLGFYVVATMHKDYHDQKPWSIPCRLGGKWWGDTERVEERLVRDAANYNANNSNSDLLFYGVQDQFNLHNRDMRGVVGQRHYNNNGLASEIAVVFCGPDGSQCQPEQ
jgi:hypothetical protein